jgi:hypothetical protein
MAPSGFIQPTLHDNMQVSTTSGTRFKLNWVTIERPIGFWFEHIATLTPFWRNQRITSLAPG